MRAMSDEFQKLQDHLERVKTVRNVIIEIDEERMLAYIYLQPERRNEEGAVIYTKDHEQESDMNPAGGVWQEVNVDYAAEGRIFGIELMGFKF